MRVQVQSQTKLVREWGEGFASDFAYEVAKEALGYAQERTRPGIGTSGFGGGGPGPHPHRTLHWDTGALRDSLRVERQSQGFLETAHISTDKPQGLYLEAGWHAPNGVLYRYPWLKPSVEQAASRADQIARITNRRWFGETASLAHGTRF